MIDKMVEACTTESGGLSIRQILPALATVLHDTLPDHYGEFCACALDGLAVADIQERTALNRLPNYRPLT